MGSCVRKSRTGARWGLTTRNGFGPRGEGLGPKDGARPIQHIFESYEERQKP